MATIKEIAEEMQNRYPEAEVIVEEVEKVNGARTGLSILQNGENIAPCIYLDPERIAEQDAETVCDGLQRAYENNKPDFSKTDILALREWENVADKVKIRVINKGWNGAYLEGKPHTEIDDLAVMYYIDLGTNETAGLMTVAVNDFFMGQWDIDKETLHAAAMANTAKGAVVRTIASVMDDAGFPPVPEDACPMYVCSNASRNLGGGVVLAIMESLRERFGTFWILPSSIHETIIVPSSAVDDREQLDALVNCVTLTQVEKDERLGTHAYFSEDMRVAV